MTRQRPGSAKHDQVRPSATGTQADSKLSAPPAAQDFEKGAEGPTPAVRSERADLTLANEVSMGTCSLTELVGDLNRYTSRTKVQQACMVLHMKIGGTEDVVRKPTTHMSTQENRPVRDVHGLPALWA
jgi:hypothetical protein